MRQDVAVVVSVCMDEAFFFSLFLLFFFLGAAQCVFFTPSSMLFHPTTSDAGFLCDVRTDLCMKCWQGPIILHP